MCLHLPVGLSMCVLIPSLPCLQPPVLVWCWDRQAPLHSLITRAATIVLQDFHHFAFYFCLSLTVTWFYAPSQFDGIAPCTDHICVHMHPKAPSVAMGCEVSFGPRGSHPYFLLCLMVHRHRPKKHFSPSSRAARDGTLNIYHAERGGKLLQTKEPIGSRGFSHQGRAGDLLLLLTFVSFIPCKQPRAL